MCNCHRPIGWTLLFVLALCVAPRSAHARFDAAKAQAVITEMGGKVAADPEIPGLSIAVLQKGGAEPVTAAFGTACIEKRHAPDPRIAVQDRVGDQGVHRRAYPQLHREGKLAYDTPISRFFPGFPNGGAITVRNLLEHSSGIVDMLRLAPVYNNMAKNWTPEELIAMAGEQPLRFQPGTQQEYSNTGFLMLACICEQITGKRYDELVRGMFVDKLGMKSLVVGDDQTIVPHLSCGYTNGAEGGQSLPIMASLAVAKGTGNIEASPSDVVRLVNLDRVLKNTVLDTVALTPLAMPGGWKAAPRKMSSGGTVNQLDGCELFLFDAPKLALVGKLGSFPGFGTAYLYDRQTKIAVAISVNNERAIQRAVSLGVGILNALRNGDAARK